MRMNPVYKNELKMIGSRAKQRRLELNLTQEDVGQINAVSGAGCDF